MPTICPNCLRPVRSEARYCGYCGSNLNPGSLDDESAVIPAVPAAVEGKVETPSKPKPKRNAEKTRRTVLVIIVILLCLVLVVAFAIHYLPSLGAYLGALITLLAAR
jgi:hypothetical protein